MDKSETLRKRSLTEMSASMGIHSPSTRELSARMQRVSFLAGTPLSSFIEEPQGQEKKDASSDVKIEEEDLQEGTGGKEEKTARWKGFP